MELGLKDRAVLITGATANIGAATAVAFGREGARVALTYRHNKDGATNTAREVEKAGGISYVLPFDLEDPDGAKRLIDDVSDHWGGLDVLVNNAVRWADTGPGPMETTFDETADWQALLHANLTGHMRVIHTAIPILRKSSAGRIVTLSTSVIRRGVRGAAIYTAAKAGLHGLTRSLAWDVGHDGVLVNLVLPGWTIDGSPMPDPLPEELQFLLNEHCKNTPTGRLTSCLHVADTIVFLSSSANGSITGEAVWVTGGFG
ncbi:MAG TPA: SDR family NAD(P)-dependent oxidoreductase [Terriglobales bacterium]|nr:SDR family NAD(P)-dependent oxidoreductase [Terriglobales bacterium]